MSESSRWAADSHAAQPTIYLSKSELLDLHTFVIERYSGRLGISSQDRLVAALDAPRQVMFSSELYPDLPSKAAALTFLLLKGRPFISNNQSTALLAMLRFLALNDAALAENIGESELLWLIRSVDQSTLDKDQLEEWLRENVVERD